MSSSRKITMFLVLPHFSGYFSALFDGGKTSDSISFISNFWLSKSHSNGQKLFARIPKWENFDLYCTQLGSYSSCPTETHVE